MDNLIPQLEQYIADRSFIAYGIVFLAGILTSLTPCVYPLYPIVASYIGIRSEKSGVHSFFLAFFYVFGLAITYSALGVLAALGGKAFGNVQSNPWINFLAGNLFILFGLALFDVFSFPMVGTLGTSSGSKGKGMFGALLLGLTSGLIAAPCSTPILLSILTFVSTTRNVLFGGTLLLSYALGMGILLVIIGTFIGILTSLPKGGNWMNAIQKICGVVVILMGEYYLIQAGKMGLFGNIF